MTQQQSTQPICCKKKTISKKDAVGNTWLKCEVCGKTSKGKTMIEAAKNFENAAGQLNQVATLPTNAKNLPAWAQANLPELFNSSALFVSRPATKRMIEKNINYVMGLDLKNAWNSEEGRRSIVSALKDSFWYGAVLPDMGSIIPFKDSVEFVPSISAFDFALTSGENAMFEWIKTIPIHENDIRNKLQIKDGELILDIQPGIPRGEVIAIAVQGKECKSGKEIGEVYDVERLMAKAKAHSKSYQYYLSKLKEHNEKQSEGSNNDFWMTNPYEGGDQVEMLKKMAGKTFFRPYVRIRNSVEMAAEWKDTDADQIEQTTEKMFDNAMDVAARQVAPEPEPQQDIKDADFEVQDAGNAGDPTFFDV